MKEATLNRNAITAIASAFTPNREEFDRELQKWKRRASP